MHAECQLSHIDILRTVKMTTALSSPFPEGGEGHKMTSVLAAVHFVPNLIAAPVLTQLGPSTKNYRYSTPIPVYYALTSADLDFSVTCCGTWCFMFNWTCALLLLCCLRAVYPAPVELHTHSTSRSRADIACLTWWVSQCEIKLFYQPHEWSSNSFQKQKCNQEINPS